MNEVPNDPPAKLDYAGTNAHGEKPEDFHDYLTASIFATLLFWPLGIVAITFSIRAKQAFRNQQFPDAMRFSESALHWGMATFALCLAAGIAVLIGLALFGFP